MMKTRLAAMFALACVGVPAATSIVRAQKSPDLAAFDKYVAQAARDWKVPGLAIAIVKDDSLVFAKGYGVLEVGKPEPATEHTRFAIGSTTKAMTTAALAMLIDEGKLHWDDRVIDYLPELRLYDAYATHELTVRDLLTHRSGLPNTDLLWAVPENNYSILEMMRRLRYVPPQSSFRSHWEYQNVVYSIAGLLVERISGMPWETFIRTRIFAPLQMTESIPLVSLLKGQPNVAVPHDLEQDTVRTVAIRTTDVIAPAGSVWSSVSDMSKWMRFMLDSGRVGSKRLIQPATFAEIVAPQMRAPMAEYPALELARPHFFSYALGWFVQDYHGETVWMHTGSIDGMIAIIGLMPDKRTGVYVLANLDHAELRHALMYTVFDLYNGMPRDSARDWSADLKKLFDLRHAAAAKAAAAAPKPPAGTHPSLPLDKYAGTYADSAYGTVVVTLANGSLRAKYGNWDIGELQPAFYDTFKSRKRDPLQGVTDVTFTPDGAGGISAVQMFGQPFSRATPSEKK
jgi:CubicO group peptidase (beta-lactamase class C family)